MAQLSRPLHDEGPVNSGEKRLQNYLVNNLPDDYYVVPNLNLASTSRHVTKYWEYDVIVVAPHAVYHIENKDWAGNLEGDDYAWFRSGQEVANPHKTANLKSRVLASKIKSAHPDWNFGQIITLVTLSNPMQTKFGLDPNGETYKQTFLLNEKLIEFITDFDGIGRKEGYIAKVQKPLVDFLTGESTSRNYVKSEIFSYRIIETLQQTDEFTEYLCVPKLINTAQYKIREYPLDVEGKSKEELEKFSLQLNNAYIAQEKIGSSPFIVKTEYRTNEENTYYYEISRYQDESSLKAKLRIKTFKQLDKVNIILDVARGLSTAHKDNVFHRNVCPENIYVYDGGHAAIANFGMAWFVEHIDKSFTVANFNGDSPYTAPELIGKDSDAFASTDLYSLGVVFYELMTGKVPFKDAIAFIAQGGVLTDDQLPSHICKDLPTWMDEVAKHTIVEDPDERWTDEKFIDFITKSIESGKTTPSPTITSTKDKVYFLKDMKPGLKISPSLTLHEMLGKGGFGRVFKAHHDLQNKDFAVKIFERDSSVDNAINEFEALKKLDHPNIVKFVWNDRTSQGLFYTCMELLEGENLQNYVEGDLRLPVDEIYNMAVQILSALVYMQDKVPPVFHRDIKPSNIMWDRKNTFKLIDFNISTTTDDKSFAGTQLYMAPDLIKSSHEIDWDCSADTFALGITIYQLFTHARPWSGGDSRPKLMQEPTDIRKYNDKLSDRMADFIMKSIITDKTKRFTSAKEMLAALEEIGKDGILKNTNKVMTFNNKEVETDYVDYLNSLYSQSHHGNSGTRAGSRQNTYDDLTYSETKLDKELIADIKALKYRLIIITGNAGDGKTAFIHRIEDIGVNKEAIGTNNGSTFEIDGLKFTSNYDGSQDEEEKANDMVLSDFFRPFNDKVDFRDVPVGRVIAINEGRLVDFLSTHEKLRALQDNIEDYFYKEGHTDLIPGLMVINLNLRSVTARDDVNKTPSLLAQQVKKLTRPDLWTKCAGCPVADRCYIKFNVDTFQDSSVGDEVILRLEWIVRLIVYKRELHITMRDLRSMIAWMLTRDYSCDEVKQLIEYVKTEDLPEYYWQYYYFNVTAPAIGIEHKAFPLPPLSSSDRLVKLLRETDIAEVALPAFDRDLYYKDKETEKYLTFSDRKRSLLAEFNNAKAILPSYEEKDPVVRQVQSLREKTFIRHQYFEGAYVDGFDFHRRLPYRHATDFYKQLNNESAKDLAETKQTIAKAISASEGCENANMTSDYLLLASSNAKDPISKSYRRFPLDEFELFVNKTEHLTRYIEYESDSLTFRHKKDQFIQLTVGLDLFEMLQYIDEGFSPSVNDLRGKFIELQIFKNLLEAKTYSEILVTKDNRRFAVVKLDDQKRIVIEPLTIGKEAEA